MKFTILEPDEFTKFEQQHPVGNFFQSVARSELRRKMGFDTYLVGVKEKAKVLAAALLVVHDNEAWIQIGPILDYDNQALLDFFLDEVKKFAKEHQFVKLEIFPPIVLSTRNQDGSDIERFDRTSIFETFKKHGFTHEGFTTEIENKANRWMFIKDLADIKDIRSAELTMNSSTRKKLHKTRRELDVHVLSDKKELKEWILALRDSDNRNGVQTRQVKYFEDLWDSFGDNAVFVEARRKDNGELVSSEVDVFHPNEMVAFIAGTVEKNKHFNGSTAIKGWNIEECLRRGYTRLNLYGMKGIFSADNPLLYFKSGLGGYTEEYIGGFRLILNRRKLLQNKIRRRIKRIHK
ncbi:peptidoglycan bridge formation glycyltransferase FemA/FemB family protein [Candidatus Saccharibacteria bacterium]|nr:peptidoglycan bridge formation glycyltransferase FemA/FemB family protein [Candidatus Saccharibacteria bacterium]